MSSQEDIIRVISDKKVESLFENMSAQLYSCQGSYKDSGHLFTDAGIVSFPIPQPLPATSSLPALIDICNDATFGRGAVNVLDKSYRDALVLENSKFAINIPLDTILPLVSTSLHSGRPIVAQLYKLNIYGPGGHFKSHVDTPRSADMVGTLVVSLPVAHEGGDMTITHKGHSTVFKTSNDGSENEVRWAAFYGDCEHAIGEVTSGYRITVTYNLLSQSTDIINGVSSLDEPTMTAVKEMCSNELFQTEGGYLIINCMHKYSNSALHTMKATGEASFLKGSDLIWYRNLKKMGFDIKLEVVHSERYSELQVLRKFYDNVHEDDYSERLWADFGEGNIPEYLDKYFSACSLTEYCGGKPCLIANENDEKNTLFGLSGTFGNESSPRCYYCNAAFFIKVAKQSK